MEKLLLIFRLKFQFAKQFFVSIIVRCGRVVSKYSSIVILSGAYNRDYCKPNLAIHLERQSNYHWSSHSLAFFGRRGQSRLSRFVDHLRKVPRLHASAYHFDYPPNHLTGNREPSLGVSICWTATEVHWGHCIHWVFQLPHPSQISKITPYRNLGRSFA